MTYSIVSAMNFYEILILFTIRAFGIFMQAYHVNKKIYKKEERMKKK